MTIPSKIQRHFLFLEGLEKPAKLFFFFPVNHPNLSLRQILDSHELYEGMIFKNSILFRSITVQIIRIIKKVTYLKIDLFVFSNEIIYEYDKSRIKRDMNYIIIRNYPETYPHITSSFYSAFTTR